MILDTIQRAHLYEAVNPAFEQAFAFVRAFERAPLAPGKYEIQGERVFALVQAYQSMEREGRKLEAHREYIDVQYLSSGAERIGYAPLERTAPLEPYSDQTDCSFHAAERFDWLTLCAGSFAVFFPDDAHMPCIQDGAPENVTKIVIKVRV